MAFRYLGNTDLDQALSEYANALSTCGFTPRTESVAVTQALGRTTAAPVYAHISAPHYNASAMDGIALAARRTFGATATTPVELEAADYVVVDTGDPLPDECDAVVMVEDVICDGMLGDCPVRLHVSVSPWDNVRQIGEDICAGEMIATSGSVIQPATIGAFLAAGVMQVEVYAMPIFGIIPTGDEIVPPSAEPGKGDVMEFNSSILSGMLTQWGAEARVYDIVPDKLELIVESLERALGECDGVLLIAGSSAGRDDYASTAIEQVGSVIVHGLAVKPGKPAVLGTGLPPASEGVGATCKPIVGMPGYPVSGIVVAEQIVRPLIEVLTGHLVDLGPKVQAVLGTRVNSSLKYREFVRVRLGFVDGRLVASPLPRGAGVVSSFMKADGILEIPQDYEGFEAGEEVPIRLMRPLDELESTLVATGSHDPIIDEIAQIMHAAEPDKRMASTHVGSMGAITAAKRRENHCGGIHLLDEATGEYNEPYLRTHFPNGGVRQVECVYRQQGLMVAPGNPLGITGMADLAGRGDAGAIARAGAVARAGACDLGDDAGEGADGLGGGGCGGRRGGGAGRGDAGAAPRFVNRQKGSGTRILSDYLCRQQGIDTSQIDGYDREVFTHLEVAALVKSGSADAGMGIYSAAKQYGLDFIPIVEEQYDLLIPDYAWDTQMVSSLLNTLKSEEFLTRAQEMGGYRLDAPGRVRLHLE